MATTLTEGAQIINQSLLNLGYNYQIDLTNNDTITEGLSKIGAFPQSQVNQIMEQMNLIIMQRNFGVMFDSTKNKFRAFLVNMDETGFGIEDIFHEILDGVECLWDDKTNNQDTAILRDLVSYDKNKIDKTFHTTADSRMFKATIDMRNYEKVFTPYGVTRYIDTKLANLSWSAEVWLMKKVIGIVTEMIENENIVLIGDQNPNNREGVTNMVEVVRSTVKGFLTPCNLYNVGALTDDGSTYRKVVQMSNSMDDIFIITTPELMERLRVQGYANAYNLNEFAVEGRILYAPAGTDLGTAENEQHVLAVVLDRRAILVGIRRWIASSFFVPNVQRTNHWLNVEILKGYNTFFNAVAITGTALGDYTEA